MDDLLSIIVPVFNAEKYIDHCIQSLLEQTYKNFELILVNDGSTDQSLELCMAFAERDNRIKVYDRQNGGASAARNTGLEKMQGKYVVFVDSDDYVTKSYLENLYLAAKLGHFDIVQCNLESTNERLDLIDTVPFKKSDVMEITKVQALNKRRYKVSVWGKIYRSHIFKDFRFQEGIIYEDDASYYIFADRAKKLAVLNETLYFYYMSENSVMRNDEKDKSTAFVEIYEDRIQYFKQRNNQELLDGTYDRFCLVLMLNLAASFSNGNNIGDQKRLLALFKKYYPLVMKAKAVYMSDKMVFTCFLIAPRLVGWMIEKIGG